jgi:leucyl/phenylalanyl-tRNA--protein transferase
MVDGDHAMPTDHDADRPPVDPGPCRYHLPSPDDAGAGEVAGVGGDLEPSTLIAAYRAGLFPMPLRRRVLGWWSPDPRGVLPLDGLKVSRSLRRSISRYTTTRNQCFERVMRACGDRRRPNGWINDDFVRAYVRLHELGWTHSVETWRGDELVGGLYGVRIGRFFAGESMFSTADDASKVALVHLVDWLRATGAELIDVQWQTPHLASLGVVTVPRAEYLRLLADALAERPTGPLCSEATDA